MSVSSWVLSQSNWKSLPPNPYLPVSVSNFEIALDGGNYVYMAYPVYNTITNFFDAHIDFYTSNSGWVHYGEFQTTNNTNLNIKSVNNGSGVSFGFVPTNANAFRILTFTSGLLLGDYENAVTNLDAYSPFKMVSGTNPNEVFFHYMFTGSNFVYQYDGSYLLLGDPQISEGITANSYESDLLVSDDSLFFVTRYASGLTNKFRSVAANRSNNLFSAYNPPISDLYAMNGAFTDTISGTGPLFLMGTSNTTEVVVNDEGSNESFAFGPLSYGQQQTIPAEVNFNASVKSGSSKGFLMTSDPSHPLENVVYEKPFGNAPWALTTSTTGFEAAGTPIGNQRLAVNSNNRPLVAYADYTPTPAEIKFKLLNHVPVETDPGFDTDSLCSGNFVSLISSAIVEDLDGDNLTILSMTSSNTSLIDPASISAYLFQNSPGNYAVYADYTLSTVATNQTVTVTFNITDGFDITQITRTYTIIATTPLAVVSDPLTICGNYGLYDLNQNVNVTGGYFSSYGYNFIDQTYVDANNAVPATVFVTYNVVQNGCNAFTSFTLEITGYPMISSVVTNATGCNTSDGSISVDVSNGSGSYQYTWSTGNTTDVALSGLNPGTYHLDVVDDIGCINEETFVIENTAVNVSAVVTDINCHGDANGAIDLTVSGAAAPYTVLWSSGYSVEDISNLQPGAHTVYIKDANDCEIVKTFEVLEPDPMQVITTTGYSSCGLNDAAVEVLQVNGGTGPFAYNWSNGVTTALNPSLGHGIYTVVVTDDNGCTASKTTSVSDNMAPFTYIVSLTDANCLEDDGSIVLDTVNVGTNVQFDWSNNASTINQYNLEVGEYILHLYNAEGCHGYDVFQIDPVLPAIQPVCIVTVDSTTTTNLVVWEKNDADAIDYYTIYRETNIPNQYMLIDTVQNSNLSIFNDVIASPIAQSWRYKIAAVDECGNEGIKSIGHKTMHLTTIDEGGGNIRVVWNFYYGVSYSNFRLSRYTPATGWVPVATLPSSLNYYVDAPGTTVGLDYMVELDLNGSCVADYEKAQDFNATRSNRDKGAFDAGNGTGDSNNSLTEETISLSFYPNPAQEVLNLVLSSNAVGLSLGIYTVDGQQVGNEIITEASFQMNVSQLSEGLYFLRLEGASEAFQFIKR